jgi:hypothetical protein
VRTEVRLQGHKASATVAGALLPALEHARVGVAEAVNRLLRVADHHQVAPRRQKVDNLRLQTVDILRFVDQGVAEHALVASAHGSGVAQQLQGADLHIVEVECAARLLEGFILAQVGDGQFQQGAGDVAGALLQRGIECRQ